MVARARRDRDIGLELLVCGLPAGKRDRKVVLMLKAYFDDSGRHKKAETFVVCGFIASRAAWSAFEADWDLALAQPRAIGYFKMHEAKTLKGEFDKANGWTEPMRDQKVADLVAVIEKHKLTAIVTMVHKGLYEAIVRGRVYQFEDHPFHLCMIDVVACINAYCERNSVSDRVLIVFDDDEENEVHAARVFHHFKKNASNSVGRFLGGIAFLSDKDEIPLQSADLLAWHIRTQVRTWIANPSERDAAKMDPITQRLVKLIGHTGSWTGERMWEHVINHKQLEVQSRKQEEARVRANRQEDSLLCRVFWRALDFFRCGQNRQKRQFRPMNQESRDMQTRRR